MHDETNLDELAGAIRRSAPPQPNDDTMNAVLVAAREGAARDADGRSRSRWWPRLLTRPVLAAGVVVVALAAAFAVLYHVQPATGFAKDDALAALRPPAGQVLHAIARSYAVNPGETPPAAGTIGTDEMWIDATGGRARSKSIEASTGAVTLDVLGAAGRFRAMGNGLLEPVDSGVVVTSAYMNSSVMGMALGDYEYIRGSLPQGTVIGKVTRGDEQYWDVRWSNVKDAGGLILSARALFRVPDYRPALLERTYEGGATTRWEVLKWEVVRQSALATSTFDPASIGKPGLLEESVWYPQDLAANISYPVYWVGPTLGSRALSTSSDGSSNGKDSPMLFERLNGHDALDRVLGGARVYAEYTGSADSTVTVSSGEPISTAELNKRLGGLAAPGTGSGAWPSAIGVATVVTSADGTQYAGISRGDSTIVVTSADPAALKQALGLLKLAR